VNLIPKPEATLVGLLDPIRFSLKDIETRIEPGSIHVGVGYAKIHSHSDQLFDEIPRTQRGTVYMGPVSEVPASVNLIAGKVRVTKTVSSLQKSVYFTSVDFGSHLESVMVSAIIKPESVTPEELTAVLGLEYGLRNTGVYLFFGVDALGAKYLRIVGPNYQPDYTWSFDWTGEYRYIIVWNEARGRVELFVNESFMGYVPLSEFLPYSEISGTRHYGGAGDVTCVYGVEGSSGNSVTLSEVAVAADTSFPFIGLIRSGEFYTTRRSDEFVRFAGGADPRVISDSHWMDLPETLLPYKDTTGTLGVVPSSGAFRLSKNSAELDPGQYTTLAIYREEPCLGRSIQEGFIFEVKFFATPTLLEQAGTGMGFLINDGRSVFQIDLLDDLAHRTVGILRKSGHPYLPYEHWTPITPTEWSSPQTIRLVVNPRRNKMELYLLPDTSTPIISQPLNRSSLPSVSDYGWDSETPFAAFGHIANLKTTGSLDIYDIQYSALFQEWDFRDGYTPDDVHTNPVHDLITSGETGGPLNLSVVPGVHPLPYFVPTTTDPPGTATMTSEGLEIACSRGEALLYAKASSFSPDHGAAIELGVRIKTWKRFNRTGAYGIMDDGISLFLMGFVETEEGKFVTLSVVGGTFGYKEIAGYTGDGAKLSFPIDWTEYHVYRMERRPLDGVYFFVDGERTPRLVVPDSAHFEMPLSQFLPGILAFGQFNQSGGISVWKHERTAVGTGYEISIRKSGTEEVVEEEVFSTRALVTAYVQDAD
jgi:hypothetical protein